jgi:transcriptional regulator GlxA family with amidase domain
LGRQVLSTQLLSADGGDVASNSGARLSVHAALAQAETPDVLFVVAETLPSGQEPELQALVNALDRVEQAGGALGGIGCGAAWLAHAGWMDGYRCTVTPLLSNQLAQAFPQIIVSSQLYEIDRRRLSCGSAHASMDLLISWLAQLHGEKLRQHLLAEFGLEQVRPARPSSGAVAQIGNSSKLAEAVALMESNLSEPLSTEDIANLVGVSRRQLERLFKQHLDTLPSRWYLEQRLARARRLLQQGSMSILQIGLSCGFTSGAHFSNAYRNTFGCTPRDERSARAAAWRITTHGTPSADAVTSAVSKEPT